jgi:hypothetical protein
MAGPVPATWIVLAILGRPIGCALCEAPATFLIPPDPNVGRLGVVACLNCLALGFEEVVRRGGGK